MIDPEEEAMGFEKFVPRAKQNRTAPQATIRKTGLISFDAEAVREFGLSEASHLVLFFDKGKKLLGVQRTNDMSVKGAIQMSRRRRTAGVKAPHFFNKWGMILDEVQRFDVTFDESERLMIIDLSSVKRRRGRRPSA
jgi:hypothetical protein